MIQRLIHINVHLLLLVRAMLVIALLSVSILSRAQDHLPLTLTPTPNSIDSLKAILAKATTPADSIVILHNLYDCYYFEERTPILHQIYETAERAKDYNSMLESLFVLTAIYLGNPEMEKVLIEMAQRTPETDIQKAYILYIKVRFQTVRLNQATEEERQQKLHKALKEYRAHDNLDKFDRIACLFLICTNLRNSTDSKLLIHYLQQLEELVNTLPKEELAIRTQFYALSVNAYIENAMYDKALEANKHALETVGKFNKLHESQGRIFRNYDSSLYNCYNNMLICAQELTDEEIDMYYQRTLDIANRNPRIKGDTPWRNATRIYYLMAKKRYDEALPLLKEKIKDNSNTSKHFYFVTQFIKAARELGDKDALLQGSQLINSIYRDRLAAKPDFRLSELQTIYDVENLKDRNRNLNFESRRMEVDRRRQSVIAVVAAVVIVMGILIWLISLYIHSRRIAKRLSASHKRLVEERNSHSELYTKLVELRDKANVADKTKSNFVANLSSEITEPLDAIVESSHLISDFAKDDDRPFIRDYSETMSVNTDLLIRLVHDIVELPKIESGDLSIQRSHSSVIEICNFALDVIKRHVAPDVEVIFTNAGQRDTLIYTDPQRVEQVLIQLLNNAAKFTESGAITFGYEISPTRESITFTVADTGIGLPDGAEDKIFNRFVKIDSTSQGSGLGLYISRLLAEMLGGTISLDTTYRDGARFIFTIPISAQPTE